MSEQLAQLALRAKFHPDEPTRCVAVDALAASHAALGRHHTAALDEIAALGEQLASVRENLATAIDELKAEHKRRIAAESLLAELLPWRGQQPTALLTTPHFLGWQRRAAAQLGVAVSEGDSGPARG